MFQLILTVPTGLNPVKTMILSGRTEEKLVMEDISKGAYYRAGRLQLLPRHSHIIIKPYQMKK